MSLARMQQQLMRDLKRSPVKASVLALLCIVALYFWAPLVFGWFGKGKAKTAKAAPAAPATVAQPTQPSAAGLPAPTVPVALPWQSLVEGIKNDPRMQSATLATLQTKPFGLVLTQTADSDEIKTQTGVSTAKTQRDLSQLGLKLSSTMLGRRRVAVINGRPYAEGSQVEAGDDLLLTVARVTDRSVLLEHAGQRLELTIVRQ
jgi:hypothetical protein